MTKTTPEITICNNKVFITGNSYPIEAERFWPVLIHELNKIQNSVIEVDLNHINTNSIYYLTALLNSNNVNRILWLCEDESDEEVAIDVKSICGNKMEILHKVLLTS